MQTQIVAMYLMTSPHSNMIGVFHCPILYIAHETGSPLEGATEGLKKLIEGGFCTYEEDSETIWVHQMANFQIVIIILCAVIVIFYTVGLVLGLRWMVRQIRAQEEFIEERRAEIEKPSARVSVKRRFKL